MDYSIYKLSFRTGVHFGKRELADSEISFTADRLFSSLCQECVKESQEKLLEFYEKVREGKILFSDAFPYDREHYYLPKPLKKVLSADPDEGNSVKKKAYKKLKYIPADKMSDYLKGSLDAEKEKAQQEGIGKTVLRNAVAVRGLPEPSPYHVGIYQFQENCGLYIICGYEDRQVLDELDELLRGLAYTGIGGKRSSGLGKFQCSRAEIPGVLSDRLGKNGEEYMLLCGALPIDEELEEAMKGAHYLLSKRSGFVDSASYAKMHMRKRDLYVFQAGSCFKKKFRGDIYDVSEGGAHPVYRYAAPLFMEVGE